MHPFEEYQERDRSLHWPLSKNGANERSFWVADTRHPPVADEIGIVLNFWPVKSIFATIIMSLRSNENKTECGKFVAGLRVSVKT